MSNTSTALSLMKMALALLDTAGAALPACHLQAAIDAAEDLRPMVEGDTIDPALEARILGPLPSEAAPALLPRERPHATAHITPERRGAGKATSG